MRVAIDTSSTRSLQKVLEVIRSHGTVSRRRIAAETGLSSPSVTRIVNELLDADVLVIEDDRVTHASGPGRPAELLGFNPDHARIAGVDIGEHTIRVALGDLRGRVIGRSTAPTQARIGGDRTLSNLVDTIRRAVEDASSSGKPIRAITVGVPGTVDVETATVRDAPNISGWHDFALGTRLLEAFPDASIRIENDVNTAAIAEHAFGVARDVQDFVFVSFRRGIGGGVFLNGELYRGATGLSGEIGFTAYDPDFSFEQADGLGHLETIAGEQQLLTIASENGYEHAERRSVEELSLRDLCLAVRAGDDAARGAIDRALRSYGVAVANIVCLLDPELIVIGGDLTLLGDDAAHAIERTVRKVTPHLPRIRMSELEEDAVLVGALHRAHVDMCDRLGAADDV